MIGLDYKEFISVGEHNIPMPPCPKKKEDVLFLNETDAYWVRDLVIKDFKQIFWDFIPYETKIYQDATLYNQDGKLAALNKEDSDWFMRRLQREMDRRRKGVYIRIKDRLVWLTGDHYFILVYCRAKRPDKKGDYFDYRSFQRDDAYLVYYTDISDWIEGLIVSKPKKTGITNFRWLIILNRCTMTKNTNYGHMNIDLDKGAKTFGDHFMYALNGLPRIFQPQVKSLSNTTGQIIFGKRYNNAKNAHEEELGTTVMCVPAINNAFDVDVFDISWYDEFPKYKQDFGEIYRSNNSATALQDVLVGKRWLTSYTPEESGKSFLSARELFYDSELRTIRPEVYEEANQE